MTATATISAVANNYTLSVVAASQIVNAYTAYNFSFSMTDSLTSTGYIELTLDPQLCSTVRQLSTVQTNLTVTVSGSSVASLPSFSVLTSNINNQSTYKLKISGLNTSSSNVPIQMLTITIGNLLNYPSVTTLTAFSLSTYYTSSSIDLVANAAYTGTIALQTGSITLQSVSSTATTTYTFGTLTVSFKNQNPILVNGYVKFTLPT